MKSFKKLTLFIALITIISSFAYLFSATSLAAGETENVAAIGSEEYATLEDAVTAAVDYSQKNNAAKVTVTLLKDATVDGDGITLGSAGGADFNVIIDGNGKTVTNVLTSASSTFYARCGNTTINNITINVTNSATNAFGALISRNTATVTLENVNINVDGTANAMSGMYLNETGSIIFKGTNTIKSNFMAINCGTGGTVIATDSSTTIKAPSINANLQVSGITFIQTTDPFDLAVAKIGTTNYATLEKALTDAVAQSRASSAATVTVELLKDTAIASGTGFTFSSKEDTSTYNVVINGNGKTVTNTLTGADGPFATFYVWNGNATFNNMTINTTLAGSGAFGPIISRGNGVTANVVLNNVDIITSATARHSSGTAIYLNSGTVKFTGINNIISDYVVFGGGTMTSATAAGSDTTVQAPEGQFGFSTAPSGMTFIVNNVPFGDPVATVNGIGYSSFEAAVSTAVKTSQADGGATKVTVELKKDVTLTTNNGMILGTDGGAAFNVVINGNDHTVKGTLSNTTGDVSSIFYVWAGKLTLNNMTIDAVCSSNLAFGAIISRQARSATANTGEEVILNNVDISVDVIQKSTSGAAVYANNYGLITFKGTNTVKTNDVVFILTGNSTLKADGSATTVTAPANMLGLNTAHSGITYVENVDPFETCDASIGTTLYATLAEAFAAAKNGNTIVINRNITSNTGIEVTINSANIVLDGNGKTITVNANKALNILNNGNGSSLLIKNLTIVGNDTTGSNVVLQTGTNVKTVVDGCKIIANNTTKESLGAVVVQPNGSLDILGNTEVNGGDGVALRPNGEGAKLRVYNAKITTSYRGIFATSPNMEITVGTGADISIGDTLFLTNASGAPTVNILGGHIKSTVTDQPLMAFSNANAKVIFCGGTLEGGNTIYENYADTSKNISYPEGETSLTLLPTMTNGASIRLAEDASGIRFRTTFPKSLIDNIDSIKDKGTEITYGTLIAPAGYIPMASGLFTMNSLDGCTAISGAKYQNIKAANGMTINTDGSVTIVASIVNIKVSNYEYAFAATGYICFTVNGETQYVYTEYSKADNSRSVYDIACVAYADVSETQDEQIYKYPISKYLVKNGNGTYSYSEGAAFTRYDGNQIKALDNYYNSIENYEYKPSVNELGSLMQPMFSGNTVKNETVMFLDYGDEKTLLYPIEKIISVTSYDGSTIYTEGKDYSIVNGKIKILSGSSIPCITRAVYYTGDGTLKTTYNGQSTNTHWGEGKAMTDYQVNVNYTHTSEWTGFEQECQSDIYEDFINKLIAGEDVTLFFYGDSITKGANASWLMNYAPYQYSYALLFTHALADLFDYTVTYVETGAYGSKIPTSDYVAGTRGTITYINSAVGGWTSTDGINNYNTHVKPFIETYGCDLFVCAFGMNDGSVTAATTNANVVTIIDRVFSQTPDTSVLMVSTMVPNPNSPNWYGNQHTQEAVLLTTAETYRGKGKACALAQMTSMSQSVLTRKEFVDYTGNNINHPNDFFVRVYAQTLLQTLIGYENLK